MSGAGTFDPFVGWVQPTGLMLFAVGCTDPTLAPGCRPRYVVGDKRGRSVPTTEFGMDESAEEYFLSFVRVISDDHERTGGPRI